MINDCVGNAVTIRAMKKLYFFESKFANALDDALKVSLTAGAASQWLNVRLQLLGVFIATSLALSATLCSVYGLLPVSPGLLGLSLSYSLTIVNNLNGLVGSLTQTEQEMIAVERVHEYIDLESEYRSSSNTLTPDLNPPYRVNSSIDINKPLLQKSSSNITYNPITHDLTPSIRNIKQKFYDNDPWPMNGNIEIKNLKMKYSPDCAEYALNDITLTISSGSKVSKYFFKIINILKYLIC
jgi:ABC-type multidrug transport system fused ATPase/permease subunit